MLQLTLLKQTSLTEDIIQQDGKDKVLHTVVKNSPFCLTYGSSVDLHKYEVEAFLIYDAGEEKIVDFVKAKPFLYKTNLNAQGNKITFEIRIKVLTSQLEYMLFRVMIRVSDINTKEVVGLGYSEAIKVISKSDQVKKKKSPAGPVSTSPKANVDSVAEFLEKMEAQTTHQQALLAKLERQLHHNSALIQKKLSEAKHEEHVPDFSTAFKELMTAYSKLKPDEQHNQCKRALQRVMNPNDFVEMSDMFWAEGLAQETGHDSRKKVKLNPVHLDKSEKGSGCRCKFCPYKKELDRIEGFYEEVLFGRKHEEISPLARVVI